MTADESAKARTAMANAMLEVTEQFTPIIDSADGVKADLERRGWSPTAAETVALQWLTHSLALCFRVTP